MAHFQPIEFGKYLLLAKIASGGMADLFQGKIVSVKGFEKPVAIKKLLPHLTQDSTLVNMFINEAKLAALLTHQNIVQIYDLGSIEGTYFIAMEYLHGKDLRAMTTKARKRTAPLPAEFALYILSRVCAGLDYAHKLKDFQGNRVNIIHRDISPQNVIVTYEGEVKVVDFGIAKAATHGSETKVGIIKGKLAYMSPEQAAGKAIDHRSDIFSAGILLYELLTHRRMFEGAEMEVLDRVRKAEFVPAETLVPNLAPRFAGILRRALAKDPDARYQSCAEMLTDLEEGLSEFPVRPGAELLGHYMKGLFAEEIAAELLVLQEAQTQITPIEYSREVVDATMTEAQAAAAAPKEAPPESERHRRWLGIWAAAALMLAMILTVVVQQRLSPRSERTPGEGPRQGSLVSEKTASTLPAPDASSSGRLRTEQVSGAVEKAKGGKLEQATEALRSERFPQAVALFEEVFAADPGLKTRMGGSYAQALRGYAATIRESDPVKAESLLRQAAETEPKSATSYFELGKFYAARKQYPRAIAAYRKAADLDPAAPDPRFNLGFLYVKTKDYRAAEGAFLRVISLSPPYLDEVYYNLGLVQGRMGKRQESMNNLKRALELNPKNAKAREQLQRLKAGG
jgi:tetratricopeptide (TPR) repeat protein/tRNA A-37 threonylcarbamoyl transferase component Bud32